MSALREANQATLERFTTGVRTLFSRYLRLGIGLTVAYALIGAAYIAFLFGSTNSALDNPIAVTLASLSVLVGITLVNFIYLLLQIVMAAEDCDGARGGAARRAPAAAANAGVDAGARRDSCVDADGDRRVDSGDHRAWA